MFSGFDACDGFFQVPVDESIFDFLTFMSMSVKVGKEIVVDTTNGSFSFMKRSLRFLGLVIGRVRIPTYFQNPTYFWEI